MTNFFKAMGSKLHDLIYNSSSRKRILSPEEARKAAEAARAAMLTMNQNLAWAQIQVNAEIEMIRMLPEGDPRIKQYRRKLKLRLVMHQYIEKMALSMEMVNAQIELGQMSAEMGAALSNANNLISTYKRDMPNFTGFVRDFMKTIPPMNEALNGGLDEMCKALDQLCGSSLDGIFSEEDLDRLISGEAAKVEPNLAEETSAETPAEASAPAPEATPVAPAAAPATKASTADLLASLEAELGNWKSKNT